MEFFYGYYHELTYNQILVTMFSHIDDEGLHFQILSEITDHKSDGNAIPISYVFIKLINGKNLPKNTTSGCKLQVEWKDGLTSWVTLKYLKASNPLELA